MGEGLFSCKQ